MVDFKEKDSYDFDDLVEIVRLLRSPEGCSWDREQTHKSVRSNFLEETYEVCEAIDNNDPILLKEELGDVLLQVVFHAQMEKENNSFSINEVITDICKKLIIRHPHVFANTSVNSTEEVLDNWDKIKMKTKQQETYSETMNSVCKALPALTRSRKIQNKAKKAGFDWNDINDVLDKVDEEIAELREAISKNDKENSFEELGDLLFATVNVSRFIDADPEESLNKATDKFIKRFTAVENETIKRGMDMTKSPLSELDSIWSQVKNKKVDK